MPNPYFTKTDAFAPEKPGAVARVDQLERTWAAPSASPFDTGRMTYEGTVVKTAGLLVALFAAAAITWVVLPEAFIVGCIVGLVLAIVISFKKKVNPTLIAMYAIAEGVFLGGISAIFESQPRYQGIALQALMATGLTTAVCLWLYRSGRVRVTSKFRQILMIGMISYMLFCVANLFVMIFSNDPGWGMRSNVEIAGIPLGIIIGLAAVVLASMSLILDFDGIKRGVEREAPAIYEWAAAFGLIVTLVWLYIEFLRMLAILRDR